MDAPGSLRQWCRCCDIGGAALSQGVPTPSLRFRSPLVWFPAGRRTSKQRCSLSKSLGAKRKNFAWQLKKKSTPTAKCSLEFLV